MDRLTVIRVVGFLVLGAIAVAGWVVLTPSQSPRVPSLPSATTYDGLIATALSDNTLNDARTDTAPQQAVVNGWVARDLLLIIAKENADLLRAQGAVYGPDGVLQSQPFDERVPALLLVGVLALAWGGITTPRRDQMSLAHTRAREADFSPSERSDIAGTAVGPTQREADEAFIGVTPTEGASLPRDVDSPTRHAAEVERNEHSAG